MSPDKTPAKGGKTVAESLQTSLRHLAWATIALYLLLFGAGVKVYLDGRATTKALCTFRADLAQRAVTATQFLKEHPNGTPGIPAKTILESISNQQRTILALKDLDCSRIPVVVPTPTPKAP